MRQGRVSPSRARIEPQSHQDLALSDGDEPQSHRLVKGIAAWRLRGDRPALALHLLAAACVAGMLLVFALGNNPINAQFAAWTPATLPPDWATLRDRWEAYHATSAALATATLVALLLGTVRELRDPIGGGTVGTRERSGRHAPRRGGIAATCDWSPGGRPSL